MNLSSLLSVGGRRLALAGLGLAALVSAAPAATPRQIAASKPVIYAFNVSGETTINRGTTATLNWSVSHGATVSISPGIGFVAGTEVDVTPQITTTYTLTATTAGGSVSRKKKITVIVPPSFLFMKATPAAITAGKSARLSWSAPGANYFTVTADPGADPGNVFANGLTVRPKVTTTYTVTAVNTAGTDVRTITLPVTPVGAKPVIGVFTATPAAVVAGTPVRLDWTVTGATSLSISPAPGVVTGTTATVTPAATTTYTLTATNANGATTRQVAVTVNTPVPLPVITAFAATPDAIAQGETSVLSWTVDGADALEIAADVGASPAIGSGTSVSVSPSATTNYTLKATNVTGTVTRGVTVSVKDPAPVIRSFAAIPNTISSGDSATIIWDVVGAASLSIAADVGPSPGVVTGTSGSLTVHPLVTTSYTMTATSPGGVVSHSLTQVLVQAAPPPPVPVIASFTASPNTISTGDGTTLNWEVTDADRLVITADTGVSPGAVTGTSVTLHPTATTTYTLTATNAYGPATKTATVTVVGPSAPIIGSFTATPSFIKDGESSTLAWSVSGADAISITADQGASPGDVSGANSFTVSPAATTVYTLTATNDIGTSTATVPVTLYTPGDGSVSHPRIWVTPQSLPALVQKAAANDPAWLRLRADCDAYATMRVAFPDEDPSSGTINGGYQYNDYLQPAEELGLAWLVTKTIDPVRAARYAAKERELLLALSDPVHHGRPSTDSGYGIRGYVPALALGYDWIFATLSDVDRAQIFTEINRWVAYFDTGGFGRNFPQGNYFAGYYAAKALGALATEGENPQGPAMWDDWLNRIHYGMVQPYHAQWLSGGGAPDGWNYGQFETINMLRPIAAAFTAKGLDLIHDAAKPFAYPDGHAKWITQFTWPDLLSVSDRGFVYDNDNPTWTDAGWATQYNGLLRLANGGNAPIMQRYALDLRAQQGTATTEPWVDFLFHDAGAPAASYRTDLSYRTIGDGQVAMRSSWDSDAVWAAFQAGPYTGFQDSSEEFFDEGGLAIQRGGVQFLVNGWGALLRNTPGTNDAGGSLFTDVYNELFSTQSDGVYTGRRLFNTYYAVRSGGYWGQVGAGPGETATTLSRFEEGGAYVLMRGAHLEGMYLTGHPITGWTRTVAYLRPHLFVVYDRTSLSNASVDNWMAWHVSAAPVELAPPAPGTHAFDVTDTRAAFGGHLYRGRVTTLLPAGNHVTAVDAFGKGKVYRLEVRTASAAAAATWLTVFDASPSASVADTAVPLTSANGGVLAGAVEGALVTAPDGGVSVVLFSTTGTAVAGPVSLSLPVADTYGLIADLAPNTGYTVTASVENGRRTVQIASGGSQMTTATGTLTFTLPAAAAPSAR